jgi:hypothetical protein
VYSVHETKKKKKQPEKHPPIQFPLLLECR